MLHVTIRHRGKVSAATLDGNEVSLSDGSRVHSDAVEFLPPAHGMIIGVELNGRAVFDSLTEVFLQPPHNAPPQQPVFFYKTRNTIIGHLQPVLCPAGQTQLEVRPNLVAVIGQPIRHKGFRVGGLLDQVSGYTILNDVSLPIESFYRPPVRAKGFDTFGPLGPGVADARDVLDVDATPIDTYVNGDLRQQASTGDLRHSLEELVAAITDIMSLAAGDMIALGAPGNPLTCAPGDEVSVEVAGIGRLSNTIVAEQTAESAEESG